MARTLREAFACRTLPTLNHEGSFGSQGLQVPRSSSEEKAAGAEGMSSEQAGHGAQGNKERNALPQSVYMDVSHCWKQGEDPKGQGVP